MKLLKPTRFLKREITAKLGVILVIFSYIGSRLIFFISGIRFNIAPLEFYMHYVDPELLKNNLLETLFYLNSQPPLYNFFLGIILKYFPNNLQFGFGLFYHLFGLSLAVSLFSIMSWLGVSKKLSTALTILFMISPACILNENWLFYTYPVGSLLCISSLFLFPFARSSKIWQGFSFFFILVLVCMTRSLFHLSYFLLLTVLLAFFQRFDDKRIKNLCLSLLLPLSLVLLLYLKNYLIFGSFSASSWLGFNFSKTTYHLISDQEKSSLVVQGKLSKFALVDPWFVSNPWHVNINEAKDIRPVYTYSSLEELRDILPQYQKTGIAVLDEEYKSNGYVNFHHLAYKDISEEFEKDALRIVKIKPLAYLKERIQAMMASFSKLNSEYLNRPWANQINFSKIEGWQKFYINFFCGHFLNIPVSIFFYISLPIYGSFLILNQLRSKSINLPFLATIGFIVFTIFWVTVTSHLLVDNEQERSRFMVEPFYIVLLGLFLERLFIKRN